MSLPEDGWSSALSSWAHARGDIKALVQIGSRVQPGSAADAMSDYDYQLVTSRPGAYRDGSFSEGLGRCWAYGSRMAFGNVLKVTAVYEGALEADFVVLRHIEVLIAVTALRWPQTARLWPRALSRGVADLRGVAGSGWRVIKGGALWERRYSRISFFSAPAGEEEFNAWCGEFWSQFVWVAKKVRRGEFRAAQRGIHEHLVENTLRMLEQEAMLDGRKAFPRGRRAELWLTPEQMRATDICTRPERSVLVPALGQIGDAFARSSAAVAAGRGWKVRDSAGIRAWLSGLLGPES
ncbi:MAG TPA: aminoglycoside 6-adenylyltransferase [Opitutaceae bacterium]|nr:aminoglycoside 6-adenylyltransferase [Opitutaceae bacterium]